MIDICKYQLLSPNAAGAGEDLLADKSAEEGQRRIQALLADWLRMENVVVLTAAGCSFGVGGRLMSGPEANNLECVVLDAVENCPLSDAAKAVIDWKKANDFGKGNFENWLSYLFNALELTEPIHSPIESVIWKRNVATLGTGSPVLPPTPLKLSKSDLLSLRGFIEKAIFAECALEIDRSEVTGSSGVVTSGHIPFLAKLIARDTNLGRTHLFTLNYDTLFEQAMEELGIQYFDGFSGKANSRFDPSVYGLDIYYPGDVVEGRVRRFDKFLKYYKLHGSIHWSVDSEGTYRARHIDLNFAKNYRSETPANKAKMLQTEQFKTIQSFGILPTSQKFTQTLDMPYSHLFRLFHARLNQPQTFLIVCGYGFGDEHVTRIIESALMNPSLVMLVIEPDPNGRIVEKLNRYQGLGQRAFALTERIAAGGACSYGIATFADFAQNVMPDVKWLDDYKRLRTFEEQLRKADPKILDPSLKVP